MPNGDDNDRPPPLDEQSAFIRRAGESDALLVAGPGTGKTFTLELTSEHLVEECDVDPADIGLLTLTRSMAGSLEERIPHGSAETLHSFALRHLNSIGEARGRRVADEWEVEELVRADLQIGLEEEFGVEIGLSRIGKYLDRLQSAFRRTQEEPRELEGVDAQLHRIFRHQRELFRYRLLDELVVDLLEHLETGGNLLDPPTHLLVDEYQDLNPGELRLLQSIVEHHEANIVACGDDRQSIYRFRDADPQGLHRFPDIYQLDEVDRLWKSKRCPQVICDLAESVASLLPELPGLDRPELEPWPGREDPGQALVVSLSHPNTEARWVLGECARLVENGSYEPQDIMIIAASFYNDVLRHLTEQTGNVGPLPFSLYNPREQNPAGNQPAVRALYAGLRLLQDDEDQMAWRTLAWATQGLGTERRRQILTEGQPTYLRCLRSVSERDVACARAVDAGDNLLAWLGGVEEVSPREVIEFLSEALNQDFEDLSGIDLLVESLGDEAALNDLTAEIRDLSHKDLVDPTDRPNGIPVRTIFGAKGLDAPVVVIVNAIEAAFSGWGEVAEGIRRLYVAISRAEDRLYLTAPRSIQHTSIGEAIGADYAGFYDLITDSATAAGIDTNVVPAGEP